MISIEHINMVGVLGIVVLVIFFLVLLHYSKLSKVDVSKKTTRTEVDKNEDFEVCFEIWKQERSFAVQRLILILTTNSILFLGYIQVHVFLLGGFIAIFALVSNALYFIYLSAFAKTLDTLQKRLAPRLPIEYRKRTLTGRWGFVPLIIILESIWTVSALCSFFGLFR